MSKTLRLLDNREKLLEAAKDVLNRWEDSPECDLPVSILVLRQVVEDINGGDE
jgi:hypothetical protein